MIPSIKLVLLGDSSVGKTLLAHRFSTDKFDAYTANTIGAAFITKEYSSNQKSVKFEIWDTAGQERYQSLTPMYYRNAQVAIICYDLSNLENSFKKAQFWLHQLDTQQQPIIKILVGNKADIKVDNETVKAELDAYATERNIQIYETSAKDGLGIDELFSGVIEQLDESVFDVPEPLTASGIDISNFERVNSKCC